MTIIEKLKDLHKQATTEHSHYYTASVIEEAIINKGITNSHIDWKKRKRVSEEQNK